MNRYEREGITIDLLEGRKVLVCASSTYSSMIFEDVLAELEGLQAVPDSVNRTNGQQTITTGQGWLAFARTRPEMTRYAPDVVLFSAAIRQDPNFHHLWLPDALAITQNSKITADQPRHRLRRPVEQLSG